MKRKVVNPDIQVKKRQQIIEQTQKKDLENELENTQAPFSKKAPKSQPKRGHK